VGSVTEKTESCASNDKQSDTPQYVYVCIYIYIYIYIEHTMSFTLRLCQYTTCFGSAKPLSGTCINVKTQILSHTP
jgi:hypothetical protein